MALKSYLFIESHKGEAEDSSPGCSLLFSVLFFGLWAALVFAVDFSIFPSVIRNASTWEYSKTVGKIKSSEIRRIRGGKADRHELFVEYEYVVGGGQLKGTRIYGEAPHGNAYDEMYAGLAREFVVGENVPVNFDTDQPDQAVLKRGIRGFDLFILWFVTPFNVLGVCGFYVKVIRQLGGYRFSDDMALAEQRNLRLSDEGVKIYFDGLWMWERLASDFFAILFAITLTSCLMIGVGLASRLDNPGMMIAFWLLAIGAGLLFSTRRIPVTLEIDSIHRVVGFHEKRFYESIPFAEIKAAILEPERESVHEYRKSRINHFLCIHYSKEGIERISRLFVCRNPIKAKRLHRLVLTQLAKAGWSPPSPA